MAAKLVTIPLDDEIASAGLNEETLASLMQVGYILYKHHATKRLNDLVQGNIEDIIQQRFQDRLHALQKENVDLVQRHELAMKHQRIALDHTTEVVQQLKDERRELQAKLDSLYQSIYVDSVQKLKDDIRQKEMEIDMLRNTNAVKGMVGETSIASELRKTFPDCEVGHTGKTAHACDVHMNLAGHGGTIVFESKYKLCIEKRDVDKFVRDVKELREGLADQMIGAVFVSMVCANIPHKGTLSFEYVEGVPVMYVAYEDEAAFSKEFRKHVKMFTTLCSYIKENTSMDETSDKTVLQDLLEDINFLQGLMNKNKKRLDDIKVKFNKYVHDTEDEGRTIMDRLELAMSKLPSKPRKTRKRVAQDPSSASTA